MFREKRLIRICFTVFVLLCLIAIGSGVCSAAERKTLTWGTTASTSGVFPYYVFTAKMLNESVPEVNITVRATGGGIHNMRMMEKAEIDIGSCPTANSWEVVNGKGSFEGKPFPDIRLLYVIMTNGLQMAVSERSGVKTLKDLEGKKFCPGQLGGGIEQYVKEIFRILGIKPDLRFMSMADSIEAMKDERIVGMAKMGVPDASLLDISSAMKIRILSFSDAELDKVVNNVVGLRKTEFPAGVYPGVGPFKTLENEWSDFVRKDFSTDIAYKIVKTLWERRAEIKKMDARFLGDKMWDVTLGVKTNYLHPGVIKFCQEQKLTVPANLVPPEMK
jgi:TRAP transporter TAXI family solute receptor